MEKINPTPVEPRDMMAYIRTRKNEIRNEIRESNMRMKGSMQAMFAAPKATNKMESFFNIVDQGMAVYDGVMLGMRVMRNIRRIFGRKR